ncbi:MAG TPA: translation initiation factor IF-3 C-terminal domain-containing protein, partial [Ktedonobacteraceae bacterium]|nr:translation initiation factor IF-3 C-terminal domain-containing protein [Ktedonobacteraceae bacterium]
KVRVSVQFRGPDMRHPDIGRRLLDEIAEVLKGTAIIERPPVMEGRMMSMIVSKAPGWEPPKKQAPPPPRKQPANPATTSATEATQTTPQPVSIPENSEAADTPENL